MKENKEREEKLVLQTQPQLQKGINTVQKPGKLPVFQLFTASEIGGRNATAVWIDSKNESSTYALSNHSTGLLEKVKIGRAFTPFQHHNLIHQLGRFIEEDTELLILPNIDYLYLDGQIKKWEAEELFQETWEKIMEIQEQHDLKVLVSHSQQPETSQIIGQNCGNTIKVDKTSQGLKHSSEKFDQMVYKNKDKLQTTMTYWNKKNCEKVRVKAKKV